jgi:hypothetical protein
MATTPRNPKPAYPAKDSAVLYGDKALYARIAATAEVKEQRKLVEKFEIPIRSGKAWIVRKGKRMFRLVEVKMDVEMRKFLLMQKQCLVQLEQEMHEKY